MRSPGSEVKTLPDDPALTNHYRSDHRIRACRFPALRRQAKGQGHVVQVPSVTTHRALRVTRDRRRRGCDLVGFIRDEIVVLMDFLASASDRAACAAANLAIATRYGEQLT